MVEDSRMDWFYAQNGQQAGPVADEELADLVRRGVIHRDTLVWHSGLADWKPYAEIAAVVAGTAGAWPTEYAGFWIRFVASILDGLILYLPRLLFQYLFGRAFGSFLNVDALSPFSPHDALKSWIGFGIYSLILTSIFSVYEGWCFSRFGALPGMYIAGLKVTRADGTRLSFLQGVGRHFAALLNSFTLGIGLIVVAFDDQKRALHDYICDTRVSYR